MGMECSCFRSDSTLGSVEISEKAVVVPLNYQLEESKEDDCQDLKTICRGYLARKALKNICNPKSFYEIVSNSIIEFQSSQITQTESKLNKYDLEINGPVYLIDDEYYQGSFNKRCLKHGKGILLMKDHKKYVGDFKCNQFCGSGRLIFDNGDIYEGGFLNNQAHGKGKYIQSSGSEYIGNFKKDKQHGYGTEIWVNGCKYEGNYKSGMKHGKGIVVYENNTTYSGDFFENRIEGKGIYKWSESKWYSGEFVDNKMHGYGELHSQSGLVYKGEFADDLKEGNGICFWPDGRIYEGTWKNGVQNGEGIFTFRNKFGEEEVKRGIWNMGRRERWVDE